MYVHPEVPSGILSELGNPLPPLEVQGGGGFVLYIHQIVDSWPKQEWVS